MKRREFGQLGIAAGAFAGVGAMGARGANDRVRLAVLGCGVRGSQHINEIADCKDGNVTVASVCDVWDPALARAARQAEAAFGGTPKTEKRHEAVLEDPEVDAVTIATPDFGHSRILREAAEAGKDAYCEKPFAVDLEEGLAAADAVRRNKRVCQVGTQWRSDGNFVACAEAVHSGVLGKVTRISISQNFHQPRWRKDYDDVRGDEVDWDEFQLHRGKRPFDPKRFKRWYLYRDYTNGLPGLWMSHYYNLIAWCMQDLFPAECVASGKVYYWGDDGRETADTLCAVLDYPTGFQLRFGMSLCNSDDTHCIFYGTNGKLSAWDRELSGGGGAGPEQIRETRTLEPVPLPTSHMGDFIECVRSRRDPRTPVEMGLAHAVAGIMTAESIRTGRRMRFDPMKREMEAG